MANLPCALCRTTEVRDESRFLVWGAGSEGVPLAKTENRGEGAGLYGRGDDLSLGCVALEQQRAAPMEMAGRHQTRESSTQDGGWGYKYRFWSDRYVEGG